MRQEVQTGGPKNPHPADVVAAATRRAKALLQRCLDDPDVSLTKALRRDIEQFLRGQHP